ncbi:hypothetical protein H6G11_00330 [Cyanobacterium aponinum FACHB-4101]|uniref:Mo-dependent nitrogenase C-terminal domain-containing protein n=1 Tax=Cyanobacterium aponinum TaxID=379064 RepID=UPI0016804ECD|nr:Mo-dependent nitrogenase C-terminal domain-containing protein [Cyanobacterium aponinum]MBD2392703.1 hypothetical protein [Cyanobacterium aponinum FACHB-4101]
MGVVDYLFSEIVLQNQISYSQDLSLKSRWHLPRFEFKWHKIDLLLPLRSWLDNIEITDSVTAHRINNLIPAECPFARKITIFNRTILTIPPLCKLNPVYDNLMALKFRCLTYLAETEEN